VPSLVPPKLAKDVALFKAAEEGTESVMRVLRALASSSPSDPALRKRAAALYGEQKNGRTALHVAIEKRERPVPLSVSLSLSLARSLAPPPGPSHHRVSDSSYSAVGKSPLVLGKVSLLVVFQSMADSSSKRLA